VKIGSLEVGRVGLGAWQAGGGAWLVDFSELKKAYEYALDNGINFIDTAEVYGNGRSEEFVGELVRSRPHVVVATKVAGFHWGRVLKSAERSRRRLGRIDLLQLHWPPPFYVPICKVIRDHGEGRGERGSRRRSASATSTWRLWRRRRPAPGSTSWSPTRWRTAPSREPPSRSSNCRKEAGASW
jgi:aryl-alcohol dehydrogenase-like predicted oxidoreductase